MLKNNNSKIFRFHSQQTYKAPEFLIKPSNRTVHEGEQFQIFSKVIGKRTDCYFILLKKKTIYKR